MKLKIISIPVLFLFLMFHVGLESCSMAENKEKICKGELCIYIVEVFEPDQLGINETALYRYITSTPFSIESGLPDSNYFKFRVCEECLFYVHWKNEEIRILYFGQDWEDRLSDKSSIIFEDHFKIEEDSLYKNYLRYSQFVKRFNN